MKPDRQLVVTQRYRTHWLQRSTASWLAFFLHLEQHLSPDGQLRRWARQNACVGAWLLVPAIFVMPAVGLILWQASTWLETLTSMFGYFVGLPLFILIVLTVVRNIAAFTKR